MIQAIESRNEFYKQKCIDFMHQAISLPGVAMRVCFNSIIDPTAEFHLFNKKNKDMYRLFKQNIVGGPSIIFNLYYKTGKTFTGNNPDKPCQKIIGCDANELYLWVIGQKLGVGFPLVQQEENNLRQEFPQFAAGCHEWIDWLAHEHNIKNSICFSWWRKEN